MSRKGAIRRKKAPKGEESAIRGKGLLCFLPRRSNNIFWSPLCAGPLCRCQNTHNRSARLRQNTLILSATPCDALDENRFQPKNYHCPDCESVCMGDCVGLYVGRQPDAANNRRTHPRGQEPLLRGLQRGLVVVALSTISRADQLLGGDHQLASGKQC